MMDIDEQVWDPVLSAPVSVTLPPSLNLSGLSFSLDVDFSWLSKLSEDPMLNSAFLHAVHDCSPP